MIKDNFVHLKYGYCYFTNESTPVLYGLFVEEAYRRQGYSKKLIEYCIKEIRESGYNGDIFIEVKPQEPGVSVEKLARYYKRFGLKFLQ